MKNYLLIFILTFCVACTTTVENRFTSTQYEKTSPENIEILNDYPSRPYTEISQIDGKKSFYSTGDIKKDIRQTAADLGADAVIILGTKTKYDFWGLNDETKAVAIKWKGPAPSKTVSSPSTPSNGAGLPVPQ